MLNRYFRLLKYVSTNYSNGLIKLEIYFCCRKCNRFNESCSSQKVALEKLFKKLVSIKLLVLLFAFSTVSITFE